MKFAILNFNKYPRAKCKILISYEKIITRFSGYSYFKGVHVLSIKNFNKESNLKIKTIDNEDFYYLNFEPETPPRYFRPKTNLNDSTIFESSSIDCAKIIFEEINTKNINT